MPQICTCLGRDITITPSSLLLEPVNVTWVNSRLLTPVNDKGKDKRGTLKKSHQNINALFYIKENDNLKMKICFTVLRRERK